VTTSRELETYTLDLLGIKEVKWEASDTELAGEYLFSKERGMRMANSEQVSLWIRESYQQLRGLSLLVIGNNT
jgi:hypothetical protein